MCFVVLDNVSRGTVGISEACGTVGISEACPCNELFVHCSLPRNDIALESLSLLLESLQTCSTVKELMYDGVLFFNYVV